MSQNAYIKKSKRRYEQNPIFAVKRKHMESRSSLRHHKKLQSIRGINAIMTSKKNIYLTSIRNNHKIQKQESRQKNTLIMLRKPLPIYLLGREQLLDCNNTRNMGIPNNRNDLKKFKFSFVQPSPNSNTTALKVSGLNRRSKKLWTRKVTGCTFVKPNFVRPPIQYERFVRPMALRLTQTNVTHVQSGKTFLANILNVEMNPNSHIETLLGKISLGTIIQIELQDNLHRLADTPSSCTYAQVTNNPSDDGTVNSVLISY